MDLITAAALILSTFFIGFFLGNARRKVIKVFSMPEHGAVVDAFNLSLSRDTGEEVSQRSDEDLIDDYIRGIGEMEDSREDIVEFAGSLGKVMILQMEIVSRFAELIRTPQTNDH